MDIFVSSSGILKWNSREYKCAIGRGGVSQEKIEGDGATPAGTYSLREVLYRADRISRPATVLPVSTTTKDAGWCDDVNDHQYNRKITLPYSASHETLWREDNIYDLVVVLGYNDSPVVPGKGSAIFMHVARQDYSPTEGCVALALPDLLQILKEVSDKTIIHIEP